jgi:hypothetical protein
MHTIISHSISLIHLRLKLLIETAQISDIDQIPGGLSGAGGNALRSEKAP